MENETFILIGTLSKDVIKIILNFLFIPNNSINSINFNHNCDNKNEKQISIMQMFGKVNLFTMSMKPIAMTKDRSKSTGDDVINQVGVNTGTIPANKRRQEMRCIDLDRYAARGIPDDLITLSGCSHCDFGEPGPCPRQARIREMSTPEMVNDFIRNVILNMHKLDNLTKNIGNNNNNATAD